MSQELKVLLSIGAITAVIIIGAVFFLGRSSSTPTNSDKVSAQVLGALTKDDSYKISSDSAKVTIVEFSDFQCPACKAAEPVTKKILEDEKGKITFVYRNFPLSQHKNGFNAAKAGEAAGEQGKFWEMHDKLFDKQEEWGESDKAEDFFVSYAKDLNLDTEKFKKDYESNKYDAKINRDQQDGLTLGVNSTPTFFVNDEKVVGVPNYDEFKSKIDSASK